MANNDERDGKPPNAANLGANSGWRYGETSNVARFAANSGCRHGELLNVAVLSLETACLQYKTYFFSHQDFCQLINFDVRLIKLEFSTCVPAHLNMPSIMVKLPLLLLKPQNQLFLILNLLQLNNGQTLIWRSVSKFQ